MFLIQKCKKRNKFNAFNISSYIVLSFYIIYLFNLLLCLESTVFWIVMRPNVMVRIDRPCNLIVILVVDMFMKNTWVSFLLWITLSSYQLSKIYLCEHISSIPSIYFYKLWNLLFFYVFSEYGRGRLVENGLIISNWVINYKFV